MRGERHDKAPEIPNLVRKKPCKRRPHHIRHRNDAVDESHLQGDREKGQVSLLDLTSSTDRPRDLMWMTR